MPTNTAVRHPRLKETCDRCSNAKVRCSRDKQCTRCVLKGVPCVYSLSRRAGRRHGSKKADSPRDVRSASSSPPPADLDTASFSPDQNEINGLFSWGFPVPSTGDLNSTLSTQLSLNDELEMNDTLLQQPLTYFPTMADPYASLISPHTMDAPAFNHNIIPTEPPQATIMHRSPTSDSNLSESSIASSQVDSVHDELTNLTEFAERMERKFDAVVRQRLQYRNVCSEFGVPDELETPILEDEETHNSGRRGPDLAEMSFYYSLAELRRRLKWLREDVGNMRGTAMQC